VISEDQGLLRSALVSLLSLEEDLDVVGQAGDGREALALIERLRPDVALLDIEMPLMSGLDVADALAGREEIGCRLIILTTFARPGYFQRAMKAGVFGYLLKDSPAEELAEAIRSVRNGRRVIHPELAFAMWEEPCPLTAREREVLSLAALGHSLQEIGAKLFLSHGTVRNYISEAMGKLGASSRIEAIRKARDKGWLD
jgi:two-component system response regulator DesR